MANNSAEQLFRGQYRDLVRNHSTLPKVIAAVALRHFKKSFQREGWDGISFTAWPEVQRRIPGSRGYDPKRQQRQLTGPGSPGLSATLFVDRAEWREVKIASRGKKYALYHNEGMGHNPRRQFMGYSPQLNTRLERTLKQNLDKIFKQ